MVCRSRGIVTTPEPLTIMSHPFANRRQVAHERQPDAFIRIAHLAGDPWLHRFADRFHVCETIATGVLDELQTPQHANAIIGQGDSDEPLSSRDLCRRVANTRAVLASIVRDFGDHIVCQVIQSGHRMIVILAARRQAAGHVPAKLGHIMVDDSHRHKPALRFVSLKTFRQLNPTRAEEVHPLEVACDGAIREAVERNTTILALPAVHARRQRGETSRCHPSKVREVERDLLRVAQLAKLGKEREQSSRVNLRGENKQRPHAR